MARTKQVARATQGLSGYEKEQVERWIYDSRVSELNDEVLRTNLIRMSEDSDYLHTLPKCLTLALLEAGEKRLGLQWYWE